MSKGAVPRRLRGVLNSANILTRRESTARPQTYPAGDACDITDSSWRALHQLLKLTRQDRDMLEHAKRYLELLTKAED